MIYFDNAATTWPKPQSVVRAVETAFRHYGANPGRSGHDMSIRTAKKVYDTRAAAAQLFNAEKVEDVVFTSNCTHAINIAIKGTLHEGDHVIISDLEHNSVLRTVHAMAEQGKITYDVAAVCGDDDETVAAFETLVRPETRLICCNHGSNVWGIRTPIKALGEMAKSRNAFFLVDAAQTAGVLDIDMMACHIDFLCMAGHKSLYGPSGTGLLITPYGSEMNTLIEGGTGTASADFSQPTDMPERMESGTLNTLGIIGLGAGIEYINQKSISTIYNYEMRLAGEIYRQLSEIKGVKLYTNTFEKGRHLPVISFNIGDAHSEETAMALSDMGFALRGGIHCAPLAHQKMSTMEVGAARVSVGAFNNMEQIQRFCSAVKKLAKTQ